MQVLFGPLFDGAIVNRKSLPSLVRATALNALRAQRSPQLGYRARQASTDLSVFTQCGLLEILSTLDGLSSECLHTFCFLQV